MSKAMVHKVLAEWRIRAVESGFIQEIEPNCLSALEPGLNGILTGAPNGEPARRWPPAAVEMPHAISEPAIVYGGPVPAMAPAPDGRA